VCVCVDSMVLVVNCRPLLLLLLFFFFLLGCNAFNHRSKVLIS
jgi:hypothetical protein